MSIRMDSSRTYLTQQDDSCWSKRSTVEKQLVVCVCVLAIAAFALVVAVCVLASNNKNNKREEHEEENRGPVCLTADCVLAAARFFSNINRTVDPCDDFYSFTCDGWIKEHRLSADDDRHSVFDDLDSDISFILRDHLTERSSVKDPAAVIKARNMYDACINETRVFATTEPLVMDILARMGEWPLATPNWTREAFDWITVEAQMQNQPATPSGSSGIIDLNVDFDFTFNTSEKIITFTHPPLGITRDYLLDPLKYHDQIEYYKNLIVNVAGYFGNETKDDIERQVDDLISFETKIANISTKPEVLKQKNKFINISIQDLAEQTHDIQWLRLTRLVFENITDIESTENVLLIDDEYLFRISDVLKQTDNRTIANYMMWKFLKPLLIHLSAETQKYAYEFAMKMTGVTQQPERWTVCVGDVGNSLGMALGRQFVQKDFSPDSKAKAEALIEQIQHIFTNMLRNETWMDDKTKAAAIDKAKNIQHRIGYPTWILNDTALDKYYENVTVSSTNHFLNLQSAAKASVDEQLRSLRLRPVDKTKWDMTPETVNAYYSEIMNSINFPAGILQPPFYYDKGLMALNFGGIGSVIGHEITHGFDDNGKKYNKHGVMADWWTPQSARSFTEKVECYVDQYDNFCPSQLNDTCVNGNLTLGENIADNGGVEASFEAYQKWIRQHGEENGLPGLGQYTPEQLFFMSFGQLWCESWRTEALRNNLLKNPHSPGKYRVLGVVANSPNFRRVFECDKKRRTHECQLW